MEAASSIYGNFVWLDLVLAVGAAVQAESVGVSGRRAVWSGQGSPSDPAYSTKVSAENVPIHLGIFW
uniref:Uncharacterized protein n=1 Tax=mine drainage metagenome TaxID=410659 RepID=E6PYU9_9ZZZZ